MGGAGDFVETPAVVMRRRAANTRADDFKLVGPTRTRNGGRSCAHTVGVGFEPEAGLGVEGAARLLLVAGREGARAG